MRRVVLGTTLLFAVLWAAMTYPQVRHMSDGVNDIGDPLLNTWALAWVAHQLPFAPAHVFDGNIFHPERRTLAYSETLLAPAVIGAPLLWLGAGSVLVYNLLLMAAFVGSGVGTVLLVRALTGSLPAALVAGTIFAFLPFRFDHYAHFQLLHTEWMPLALWGFHRLLATQHFRWAVVLGTMVGAQALTSMYNALFLGSYLVVVGGTLLMADRRRLRMHLPGLALAVVLAGALAAPVAIAHVRVREVVGERSRGEVQGGSAQWRDLLVATPNNALYGSLTAEWGGPERRLFLGVTAAVLAIVGLWPPWSATRVAYGLGLIVALEMARGLNGWLYPLLYDYAFVFRGLRMPGRMVVMAGLSLAVLAGYGVARILPRLGSAGRQWGIAVVLMGLVLLDAWSAPLSLATIPATPPGIYDALLADKGEAPRRTIVRRLSDRPPVVIAEFPINQEDPTYMYYSTFHWQTLVNGYSGFYSTRYVELDALLRQFPAVETLEALARLQTRYVVIHGELLPPARYAALTAAVEASPSFRLVAKQPWKGSELALYRFAFVRPQ
jgi:hypothetical protein